MGYHKDEHAGQAEGEEGGAGVAEFGGIIQYLLFIIYCQNGSLSKWK